MCWAHLLSQYPGVPADSHPRHMKRHGQDGNTAPGPPDAGTGYEDKSIAPLVSIWHDQGTTQANLIDRWLSATTIFRYSKEPCCLRDASREMNHCKGEVRKCRPNAPSAPTSVIFLDNDSSESCLSFVLTYSTHPCSNCLPLPCFLFLLILPVLPMKQMSDRRPGHQRSASARENPVQSKSERMDKKPQCHTPVYPQVLSMVVSSGIAIVSSS